MSYHFIISTSIITVLSALKLKLTQNDQALCLDGSQSSYYFGEGKGSGAKNFLIHFQGGGAIEGLTEEQQLQAAYLRSLTNYGSSKELEEESDFQGLFSTDQSVNPDFYNWNMVHINYCDGSGHQGYRKDPIQVNGVDLYFRGEVIVKQILSELPITTANTVVVTGCSAGGLAVYYWVEYVRSLLPSSVKMLGIPDSGLFLDMPAFDGTTDPIESFKILQKLVNQERPNPSEGCVQNEKELWKCYYAQYLLKYIRNVPLFIVESLYDSQGVNKWLKLSCAKNLNLTQCNSQERAYIEGMRSNVQIVIDGIFQTTQQNGVFGISCLTHCFLLTERFTSSYWAVPYQSSFTVQQTLGEWVKSYQSVDQYYNYHVDQVTWPNNLGCA